MSCYKLFSAYLVKIFLPSNVADVTTEGNFYFSIMNRTLTTESKSLLADVDFFQTTSFHSPHKK